MPTIEEIKAAAEVLDALFEEDAELEITTYGSTYFAQTSRQLRELASMRAPKPRKVFVDEWRDDDSMDVIVYIERHDGQFVGVYVGECWDGVTLNKSLRPDTPSGEQVWGNAK